MCQRCFGSTQTECLNMSSLCKQCTISLHRNAVSSLPDENVRMRTNQLQNKSRSMEPSLCLFRSEAMLQKEQEAQLQFKVTALKDKAGNAWLYSWPLHCFTTRSYFIAFYIVPPYVHSSVSMSLCVCVCTDTQPGQIWHPSSKISASITQCCDGSLCWDSQG